MGQRLNIEITKGEKVLANAYYHWSGFTHSAVQLTKDIIRYFDYANKYKNNSDDDIVFAIRLLERTGAGLDKEEYAYAESKYPDVRFKNCIDRTEGIISITEKGIDETEQWEEARVTIDIDKKTLNFDKAVVDTTEIELKEDGYEIYETNIKLKNIKFEEIFDLEAFIEKAIYLEHYYFKNNYDNTYFYLIE